MGLIKVLFLGVFLLVFYSCGSAKYYFNAGAQSNNISFRDYRNSDEDDIFYEGQGTIGHIGISEDTSWFLTHINMNFGEYEEAKLTKINNEVGTIRESGWEAVLSLNFPYIKPRYIFGQSTLSYKYQDLKEEYDFRTRGHGIGLDFPVSERMNFYLYYDEIKNNPLVTINGVAQDKVVLKRVMVGLRFHFYTLSGVGRSRSKSGE